MSARLFPSLSVVLCASVLSVSAQIDATVTRIVDEFNAIEQGLGDMQRLSFDASHADGDYTFGQIEIWLDHGEVAKVRNEFRDEHNVSIQEYWITGNAPIFAYERSEWHGNEDGTVNLNEYRYYLDGGQAIREMSRSDTRPAGGSHDLSNVAHQKNDDIDPEYGRSLFEDKENQVVAILKVANAFSGNPVGAANLVSLPYRLLLQTLSPDGKRCFAWGIEGVTPDWPRWERERYEYLETLGEPRFVVHLVDLSSFRSIGTVEAEFEPGGMPWFWAKWSDDGGLVIAGSDYRWATGGANAYRVAFGAITPLADLGAELSRLAIDLLRERDHPYAIDSSEAAGFIDVKSFDGSGRLQIDYAIESKFEGSRRNARVAFDLQLDVDSGAVRQLAADLPDYVPVPTTWEKLASFFAKEAPSWMVTPPALPDYLQLETFINDGVHHLYNRYGNQVNQDLIEILIRRPLYLDGPHYPGGVVTSAQYEFGRYDPESVRLISEGFASVLNGVFLQATRPIYEAEFASMARHFQESLRYWNENPAELERQKTAYLAAIANQTLPENYYLLEGNVGETLMMAYSADWDERTCYLTALRFWLRRACDGSFEEFADLLQRTIAAYDPAYFSQRGLPELQLAHRTTTLPEENGPGAVMEESGALGIDHLVPFSLSELRSALPGFDVSEKDFFDEGGQYPAFSVSRGGREILTLIRFDSGDPLAFEIRSTNIELINGTATGDTFGEVFRQQRPLGFFNGLETDVGAVMAEAPGSERITLLFHPPPGAGDEAYNPGLGVGDMSDFVLTEVRWTP